MFLSSVQEFILRILARKNNLSKNRMVKCYVKSGRLQKTSVLLKGQDSGDRSTELRDRNVMITLQKNAFFEEKSWAMILLHKNVIHLQWFSFVNRVIILQRTCDTNVKKCDRIVNDNLPEFYDSFTQVTSSKTRPNHIFVFFLHVFRKRWNLLFLYDTIT